MSGRILSCREQVPWASPTVDFFVNVIGDLFEQPLIMWAFIGWGWLAVLVMITSMLTTAAAVFA